MRHFICSKTALVTITALVCFGLVSPSSALTLSLPELAGDLEIGPWVEPNFDFPYMRECDFVIPDGVTTIENLVFVLSGEWNVGEITCNNGFGGYDVSPLLPPIAIFITSDAFPGDYFLASIVMPDGPFDSLAAEFESYFPPNVLDFDDLLGVELHAELFIDYAPIGICGETIDSYGTLEEVQLQLTGPVPTVVSSWGQVKSLYR